MIGRNRATFVALALAAAATTAAVAVTLSGAEPDRPDRQDRVADRGRDVMPFDLERTTHRFTKSATGGLQTVTADDPADTRRSSTPCMPGSTPR